MAKKMVKKLTEKDLNTYLAFLLLGVIFGVLCTKLSAWSHRQSAPTRIHAALPSTHIDAINATPIKGLYQVTAGDNTFYADSTGRYLVFGHIYDIRTRADITATQASSSRHTATEVLQQTRPVALASKASLPVIASGTKDNDTGRSGDHGRDNSDDNDGYVNVNTLPGVHDAIQSGIDNGIPLAVFLDPDCPYCQALQAELAMQNHDLSVREYLMPIPELHPDAPAHASAIWCAANPLQALNDYMINGKLPTAQMCDTRALTRIRGFTDQQGWQATPTLVRADGAMYQGYMPYGQLVAWAKAGLTIQQGGAHA